MSDTGEDIPNNADKGAQAEKLYARLEKIIARIREDTSEPELLVSLRSLFAYMRKINDFEQAQLEPGETYEPLTLERIYQLASSGDGGNTSALQEANAAFAEENQILVETIQSLTFQLDVLKRQSIDEIIKNGDEKVPSLKALKATLVSLNKTIDSAERSYEKLVGTNAATGDSEQKPLDERFAEAIGNYERISPDLLKLTPNSTTMIGRMLRRYGFAYDYKDVATVHHLVQTLLKTNHKLAEINETLMPAKEQIDRLRQSLSAIELYVGHEERQQPQYKEAMEEIDRLRAKLDRYEQITGDVTELEKKRDGLDADILNKELRVKNLDITLRSLQDDVLIYQNMRSQQVNDIPPKGSPKARTRIHPNLHDILGSISGAEKYKADAEPVDPKQKTIDDQMMRIGSLRAQVNQLTKELDDLRSLNGQQQQDLMIAEQRLYASESGMIGRKLEAEISALRREAVELEEKLVAEAADRVTLEERITSWVEKEEDLTRKSAKWQKIAGLKASFFAAATGAAAIGGVYASQTITAYSTMSLYLAVVTTTPGIFMGCVSAFKREGAAKALRRTSFGCMLGALTASLGVGPMIAQEEKGYERASDEFQAQNRLLIQQCSYDPCRLSLSKDGNIQFSQTRYEIPRAKHDTKPSPRAKSPQLENFK